MIVENGTPILTGNVDAAPNGGDFVIGDIDDPGLGPMVILGFIGEIQNVIVGTDDLTPAEEEALYAGTAPGDETNYWYIDEGTGTDIIDYGTGGNDGTADTACSWETATFTTGSTGRLCDFYIEVDDGVTDPDRWGANLKGASVVDNANDWILNQNDVMPSMEYYKHTVGGVTHAWYQPNYIVQDDALIDRSYYGIEFDGINDNITHATFLDAPPANVSISLWFCPTVTFDNTAVADEYLFNKINIAAEDRAAINLDFGSGTLRFWSEYNNEGTLYAVTVQNSWTAGTWYNYVVTFDGTTIRTYVDGVVEPDTETPNGLILNGAAADMFVGAYAAANMVFDGKIDEFVVYDGALTQPEITANYNAGVGNYIPSDSTGLICQWHMEEGTGAATTDTSGEGNTGTITGATWVNGIVPRPAGNSGTNDAVITYGGRLADSGSVVTLTDSQLTQADDYWNGYTLKIKEVAGDAAPEGEGEEILDFTLATLGGTADGGLTTTMIDATLLQPTAYWVGTTITIVTTTDGLAPQGESAVATVWDLPTHTLTFPALTAAVEAGDTYTLTAANTLFTETFTAAIGVSMRYEIWDGQTILWGSFPEGISVEVGPLTAYTDPVSSAAGLETPEVAGLPPEPSGMWGGAASSDLPMYDLFNTVAAQLDWETSVLYVVAWMVLSIGLGVALLITTGSGLGAIAGVGVGMVGGMATGMLPVWVLLVYLVLAVTWLYTSRAM